mmetsp:Transcript_31993/g.90810  ORF Transcript_31993/g.90810 Transcript_31993/m.90810 type:complete len:216 (-) Transcript_31993:78-725(-)
MWGWTAIPFGSCHPSWHLVLIHAALISVLVVLAVSLQRVVVSGQGVLGWVEPCLKVLDWKIAEGFLDLGELLSGAMGLKALQFTELQGLLEGGPHPLDVVDESISPLVGLAAVEGASLRREPIVEAVRLLPKLHQLGKLPKRTLERLQVLLIRDFEARPELHIVGWAGDHRCLGGGGRLGGGTGANAGALGARCRSRGKSETSGHRCHDAERQVN